MNKEKFTLGTKTWKEIHSNSYKEIKLSLAQELTEEERTEQVLRATLTVSFILNEVMLTLCNINLNAYKLPVIYFV